MLTHLLTTISLQTAAVTQYTFTHKIYVDVLIHLLTAVGLTPCVSNTGHIYTQTVY